MTGNLRNTSYQKLASALKTKGLDTQGSRGHGGGPLGPPKVPPAGGRDGAELTALPLALFLSPIFLGL